MTKLLCLLTLAVLLGGCSVLDTLNALSPGGASQVAYAVAYGAGPRHRLDIYRPRQAAGPVPVVVFFYGGNWVIGGRADYAFVGRALASRGMLAMVADYRLYPEVRYPAFLDDAAQAVAWAARHAADYGGDPQRLFVMGHSAGAYIAAMVALDGRRLAKFGMAPSALRGWIGLAGPYDFMPIQNPTARPVFHYPDTPRDSQPIEHVSAQSPPALLIAAKNDELVNPKRNTGRLAERLRGQGVAVRERYFGRVNHITLVATLAAPARWLAPTLDEVEQFVGAAGGQREAQRVRTERSRSAGPVSGTTRRYRRRRGTSCTSCRCRKGSRRCGRL